VPGTCDGRGFGLSAVAAGGGNGGDGTGMARLYSRTGEDISKSFPDLLDALHLPGALDGELLILRDRRVQSFNVLQQRLNRKTVTPKLLIQLLNVGDLHPEKPDLVPKNP